MNQHDTRGHGAEALPALRELSLSPVVSAVWTEIDGQGHRIWLARGRDGHPWLLATDSLARFRNMISELPREPGSAP